MADIFTPSEILENYNELRRRVNVYFESNIPRRDALNRLYDHFEDRIAYTPASGRENFHNCCPGGYIDHVLRVIDHSIKIYKLNLDMELDMSDISKESILFCAMHHDLGKIGSLDHDVYVPNPSDWHVQNQGKVYIQNPEIHWMDCNTRTFHLLNQFGIICTEEEWISMKLTDGLYDESNSKYYITYEQGRSLKTHLPHILHHADMYAVKFEEDRWKKLQAK
jgi:hypothetical protein